MKWTSSLKTSTLHLALPLPIYLHTEKERLYYVHSLQCITIKIKIDSQLKMKIFFQMKVNKREKLFKNGFSGYFKPMRARYYTLTLRSTGAMFLDSGREENNGTRRSD